MSRTQGVIQPDELGELQQDMHAAIDGATAARDASAHCCHSAAARATGGTGWLL